MVWADDLHPVLIKHGPVSFSTVERSFRIYSNLGLPRNRNAFDQSSPMLYRFEQSPVLYLFSVSFSKKSGFITSLAVFFFVFALPDNKKLAVFFTRIVFAGATTIRLFEIILLV